MHWLVLAAGAILGLIALVVLVRNEQVDAAAARAADGIGGAILDLGARPPGADADGRTVRVTGTTQVARRALDPQFGVSADAPALMRKVEMLQWRELDTGIGPLEYEVRWLDHAVDSSRFRHSEGHANPGAFPFDDERFDAGEVRLDGLVLAHALVRAIPGSAPLPADARHLPDNLAASLQQDGDGLTTAADPRSPRIGDLRIRWSMVPNQALTVLALASHGQLQASPHLPAPGFVLMLGDVPLDGVLPGMARPPSQPWTMRIVALALAVVGAFLVLLACARHRRVDPAAVLALGVLPLALVGLVSWWGVRTAAVAACVALLAFAVFILFRRREKP
jgi:hypothetical protein